MANFWDWPRVSGCLFLFPRLPLLEGDGDSWSVSFPSTILSSPFSWCLSLLPPGDASRCFWCLRVAPSVSSSPVPSNISIISFSDKSITVIETENIKHKPTNVGRIIALERQAGGQKFATTGIRTIDLTLRNHMPWRLCYLSLSFSLLQPNLNWQQALLRSENNRDHSKIKNESVKKSLEKCKNVLEEKRKMVKQKFCMKKTNTYFTSIQPTVIPFISHSFRFWKVFRSFS